MERYKSNEKINNKTSTFSALKNFLQTSKKTEKRFFEATDRMEELENQEGGIESQEYIDLSSEVDKLDKKLEAIDKAKTEIKKLFLKIGTITLATTIAITGTLAGISYGIQSSRENRVMEALENQGYNISSVYKESHDKLAEFAKSPEKVTQLALDTLKQNLANHYGVSNKNDFEVLYRTEPVDKHSSATKTTYEIKYKGQTICADITIIDSSGDKYTIESTMPDGIKDATSKIVKAQEDPSNVQKAHSALKAANGSKTNDAINKNLTKTLPQIPEFQRDDDGR
jgi:hypothetical protein